MNVAEDSSFRLTELESQNKKGARNHFLYIYGVIILSTCVSVADYLTMWDCTNVCGTSTGCSDMSQNCGSSNGMEITWTTDNVEAFTWLNRFMHATIRIQNEGLEDDESIYGVYVLRQQITSHKPTSSSLKKLPYIHDTTIDLTGCEPATSCVTPPVRIMSPSGHAISSIKLSLIPVEIYFANSTYSAHNETYTLSYNLPPVSRTSIKLEYQSGSYTYIEFTLRVVLLACSICVYFLARGRLARAQQKSNTPEQQWINPLLMALVVYLNPLMLLAAALELNADFRPGNTWQMFLEFVEFHSATYFTIFVQIMVVFLMMRLREGRVGMFPKVFWGLWSALMISLDVLVAVADRGPSSDYTSTYIGWVLTKNILHLSFFQGSLYVSGLVLTAVWILATAFHAIRLKQWLRKAPYGPTRRRQLVFRSLVFVAWGYAVSRTACLLLYWLLLGKYRPAYRSADEVGTLLLSSSFAFSLVFQFSPSLEFRDDTASPPLPGEPSWESPRWRRSKWTPCWYKWLSEHGGSMYYFVEEEEQLQFDKIQESTPVAYILVRAHNGWPLRSSPEIDDSNIISILRNGTEVSAVQKVGKYYLLSNGYYVSQTESDSYPGIWMEADKLGFTLGIQDDSALKLSSLANTSFGGGSIEKDRLFFCVETAAKMADLAYAVYYPPGARDLAEAAMTGDSFGWKLITEQCSVIVTLLCGAISSVATGLIPAPAPTPRSSPTFDDYGRSSPSTPTAKSPLCDTNYADLSSLNVRLVDVIELAGTRAFITIPKDGTHSVIISFRGSDNRYNRVNLTSDLRFGRKTYKTMARTPSLDDKKSCLHTLLCCCGCVTKPLLHRGFLEMWEKSRGGHNLKGALQEVPMRDAVLLSVERAIRSFGVGADVTVYCTGHSMGAAMACLLAYALKLRRNIDSIVYTFGLPRLGNQVFKKSYESVVPNTFRVVYEYDPVVHVSGTICNMHVGREVCLDRNGNLLVEPSWVEKTFQPTKKLGVADMAGHGLDSYLRSINRVFLRAGSLKRSHYPTETKGSVVANQTLNEEGNPLGAPAIPTDFDDDIREIDSLQPDRTDDTTLLLQELHSPNDEHP
eukprot:TRINITY_DN2011_c2_g1_i1.p1 TRINITY_DN2011_c2_g1~~TRINITY_DN2011_c2_g1_i1.p1  ORF type:complete len:1084 (+),score=119.12 TRINITY_DN2011_c2_g1_i1:43-3294(+)